MGKLYRGQWITLKYAAEILGWQTPALRRHHLPGLPYRVCEIPGVGGKKPILVREDDVRRVKLFMDRARLDVRAAARVVATLNELERTGGVVPEVVCAELGATWRRSVKVEGRA